MKVCVVDPASIKNDQTSQFQQHRQQTPIAAAKYLIISYIKCMQHNRWICAAAHFTDQSFPQKSSDCSPHKPHNRIKNHPVRSISLELNCFHAMLTIMIMVVCVSVCSPASSKHSHAEQIPDLPCNNADLPTSPLQSCTAANPEPAHCQTAAHVISRSNRQLYMSSMFVVKAHCYSPKNTQIS